MRGTTQADDTFETCTRREDVLAALAAADGPVPKGDLVEAVACSRSTVDRAIRELEAKALVDRIDGQYAPTLAGRLSLREMSRCKETLGAIEAASELLAHLPPDAPVSRTLFDGASVRVPGRPGVLGEQTAHAELVAQIVRRIREADRIYGFTPVEPNPRIRNAFETASVDRGVDCEVLLETDLARYLLGNHADQLSRMVTGGAMTLRQAPSLPYGLGLYEIDGTVYVHFFPYGESARLLGLVENTAPGAVAWADAVFRRYRANATLLTPE